MINFLLIISFLIVATSVVFYLLRSAVSIIKVILESSKEIYINEAEKLLLSNIKVPVSIIIPPIKDYTSLIKTINASFEINHPMYQVLVMLNKDSIHLNRLITEFGLVKLEAVYRMVIKSANPISTYRSTIEKRLSVIISDSNNKSSIINLGIDVAMYPFICIFSEEFIPSKDLLLTMEPPVISDEGINVGSITSTDSDKKDRASWYYIKSIYAYSNHLKFSLPSDFAVLLKKKFLVEKNGMKREETLPQFLRSMMKEGLQLISVAPVGVSSEKNSIFINIITRHLNKIICGLRLSTTAVILNNIYYIAFLLLNFVLFYILFSDNKNGLLTFIPLLVMFIIIPLKDIIILLIESLLQKRIENPNLMRSILLAVIKQLGIEQIISIIFILYSLKRFLRREE